MGVARRALLSSLAAAGLVGAVRLRQPAQADYQANDHEEAPYLSAGSGLGNTHHVAGLGSSGRIVFANPLPARGHAVAVSPDRRTAVLSARRPGRFAVVIDLPSRAVTHVFDAAEGRYFYGHAAFSADGLRLFATENAYAVGDGRIGIYDAASGFRRLGEWSSHGIGPHELALMPDGRTLVVANGGILTHPDSGREKLNVDSMEPSVVFIDSGDGNVIDRVPVPRELNRLSTRHLAIGRGGTVAVVMPYEGSETDLPPLVGLIDRPGRLRLVSAPEPVQIRMASYCGSVAFDSAGRVFGVSSPHGGLFTYWNLAGEVVSSAAVVDGCGIAANGRPGGFLLSNGLGGLWQHNLADGVLRQLSVSQAPVAHWDNHLTAI